MQFDAKARATCEKTHSFANCIVTRPQATLHNHQYMSTLLLDANDIKRSIGRIAHEILEANHGASELVVVGVLNRGYPVAKRLAFLMTQIEGETVPCGKLDITKYRDDDRPKNDEDLSEIPFQVNGKTVILVDEVIYTGRTIRAAMDGIMHFGRPQCIQLATLIDRGHRELPIQPDYLGREIVTERSDHIVVKIKEVDGEDGVWLMEKTEAMA